MPATTYPFSLLQGLSDFWTRFFADADQLDALYRGSAALIGQAYLDLMSATLGVSLKDAIALDREQYRMLAMREDELRYVKGVTPDDDRWAFTLPDGVVSFASIDNRVVEPTASLEPTRDYDIVDGVVLFRVDPTNRGGLGVPLDGYARRSLDIAVGGVFSDPAVPDWIANGVRKGDTLRTLDVGTDGAQRKRVDYEIAVARSGALYVAASVPLAASTSVSYVVVRTVPGATVLAESMAMPGTMASLAHGRLDAGSLRIYAKGPTGADVVEGVDYVANYEAGVIQRLTTWQGLPGPFGVDYTWKAEVSPVFGPSPRCSTTGVAVATTTTRVIQLAAWAPDAQVDRRTLARNFGTLIGREAPSSEAYRAFLEGIFQLYVLGPVLERIESALNVVLNLPVVRDDGEVYQATDTSDPLVDRITTLRGASTATYEFPKGTPLRTDLVAGMALLSFEPLTTAVAVTDYVQTPSWWYGETIPKELFAASGEDEVPDVFRRIASPYYVEHVIGASDMPRIGDPGLKIGSDENGFIPDAGHRIFRHRMAFVLMDRYLKYHTFSVKFDAAALSASTGTAFAQSLTDLNALVLSARPSHTYAFTTPSSRFRDEIAVGEDTISFDRLVGSRVFGPDKVVFTDDVLTIGGGGWRIGDYFHYELVTASTAFPSTGVPVTLSSVPSSPRRRRLVRVYVNGNVGGVALVENVDYSVDYAAGTVTRLTSWASTTVNVTFRQLNIGNTADVALPVGDAPLLVNGVDPALVTAAFDPSAAGWDGVTTPTTAPRDIALVERALVVSAHA